MLDYTKEDETTKTFISNFWKTEDALVVNTFANGMYKLEKTKENEDYLISMEEEQAEYMLNSDVKDKLLEEWINTSNQLKKQIEMIIVGTFLGDIIGFCIVLAFFHLGAVQIITALILSVIVSVIHCVRKCKRENEKYQIKLQDIDLKIEGIDKINHYLKNQKVYNKNNKLTGQLLMGLKQRDISKLEDYIDTPILDTININTIDDFSLETLEQIRMNMRNTEEYQEKSKTLQRR